LIIVNAAPGTEHRVFDWAVFQTESAARGTRLARSAIGPLSVLQTQDLAATIRPDGQDESVRKS
jgi:hypothetical protein